MASTAAVPAAARPRRATPCSTRPSPTPPTPWGPPLAGCRAVAVPPARPTARPRPGRGVAGRRRAGPAAVGQLAGQPHRWAHRPGGGGRLGPPARACPVFSDECYTEFTWDGPRARSSSPGPRAWSPSTPSPSAPTWPGCGSASTPATPTLVGYLRAVRQHAGLMVPGPVQAAAAVALADDEHVADQRERYLERLRLPGRRPHRGRGARSTCRPAASTCGSRSPPAGPTAWALAEDLAEAGGLLVSPGELYGEAGRRPRPRRRGPARWSASTWWPSGSPARAGGRDRPKPPAAAGSVGP